MATLPIAIIVLAFISGVPLIINLFQSNIVKLHKWRSLSKKCLVILVWHACHVRVCLLPPGYLSPLWGCIGFV